MYFVFGSKNIDDVYEGSVGTDAAFSCDPSGVADSAAFVVGATVGFVAVAPAVFVILYSLPSGDVAAYSVPSFAISNACTCNSCGSKTTVVCPCGVTLYTRAGAPAATNAFPSR